MSKISGIYQIQSKIKPERIYIGSAVDIKSRWKRHLKDLKRDRHHSRKLQRHYNKYGKDDLIFSIITPCTREELKPINRIIRPEQFFMWAYNPYFNNSPTAGSPLGVKWDYRRKVPNRKTILQYDLDGNFIKEWVSSCAIKRKLKIDHSTIRHCCRKDTRAKTAYGFMWLYKTNENIKTKIEAYVSNCGYNAIPIIQYDLQGNFVKEWGSALQAAKILILNPSHIRECCRGELRSSMGYIWKYKNK